MTDDDIKVTDKRGAQKSEAPAASENNNATNAASTSSETRTPPAISFSSFVFSLSSAALVQMGLIEDPITKKKEKNLGLAKQQVDILEIIAEKTKGNLDADEEKLMSQVLYELRLRFVEASK